MTEKHKKSMKAIVLSIFFILILGGSCILLFYSKNTRLTKEKIINIVQEENILLSKVIKQIMTFEEGYISNNEENGIYYKTLNDNNINNIFYKMQLEKISNIKKDDAPDEFKDAIFFTCKNPMRWNKTSYWGFYYSYDGERVGFYGQNHYYPEEKEGIGYKNRSGVYYYTEKICENWYYFEAIS